MIALARADGSCWSGCRRSLRMGRSNILRHFLLFTAWRTRHGSPRMMTGGTRTACWWFGAARRMIPIGPTPTTGTTS